MNKVIKRIAAILIAVTVFFVFVSLTNSALNPKPESKVWDMRTTMGSKDAKNYYVVYTDIACPYCTYYSRAIMDHEDEVKQFLEDNDTLYEVRVTDYIYEAADIDYSRTSAEATYCATEEDRFWDYYHAAVKALWDDYQSKGYASSKTAPPIKGMPDDYWVKIGEKIGLSDQFANCVNNHKQLDKVKNNTTKAISTLQQASAGLPYFHFNDFSTSGFSDTWGWSEAKEYLDAGLKKQ